MVGAVAVVFIFENERIILADDGATVWSETCYSCTKIHVIYLDM